MYGGLYLEGRRYVGEFRVGLVEKEKVVEVEMYLFSDMIFIVEEKGMQVKFVLDETSRVKVAPDAKYFKNVLCINNAHKTLTFSMKTAAKKQEVYSVLKKSLEPLHQSKNNEHIDVLVEGTEERDSFFKKYTVYIIKIRDANQ